MGLQMESCCPLSRDAFLWITQRLRTWIPSAQLSLEPQMADGMLLPAPCSLARLLPNRGIDPPVAIRRGEGAQM